MASPSENSRPRRNKTPYLKYIDKSELVLPRRHNRSGSASSPDLKALTLSVTFCGWRFASKDFRCWAHKMSVMHEPTWRKAGIFEAIMASTKTIHKDTSLVLSVAEKWCPETKSFVFPWGEATITLEDVMLLLGFSVLGSPVSEPLNSSGKKTKAKLDEECLQIRNEKGFGANQKAWVSRFMDSGDELEHVAFLASWLSYFVFPPRYYHLTEDILSIAVHLSTGTRIALAPPVLAHLYAELSLLRNHIRAFNGSVIPLKVDLSALFKLVQVWTWERFRKLRPPKPNPMREGEPRLALWHDLKQRASDARKILENSTMDSFEWRPYTKALKNWKFPQIYRESEAFAQCIRVSQLVGIGCVEHYFPNRVASQFGMVQDVLCLVNRNNLSHEAVRDDLKLDIPSRSAKPRVTSRLWKFPALTARGDGTSLVHPGSKMNRTSKDEMKIADKSRNKRGKYMERARVRCQTQVPSDNDDKADDRLAVSQRVKRTFTKTYSDVEQSGGDASEQLGKRSRLEADNNDSSPRQKLASERGNGDEAVPPPEIEKRNEETGETGSKAGKSIVLSPTDENNFPNPPVGFEGALDIVVAPPETNQTCDDDLDVHGSNADMETMIDDGNKEPNCLLHVDGVIAGVDEDESVPETEKVNEETNESGSEAEEINVLIQSDENYSSDPPLGANGVVDIVLSQPEKRKTCGYELAVSGSNAGVIYDGRKEPEFPSTEGALALMEDKSSPHQDFVSEGICGDETSKAHASMVLRPSDESNIHIIVGDGTQGQDSLLHENDADDGRKEPDCLLQEDGVITGENQRSDEKACSSETEKACSSETEDDVVDDDSLIQQNLVTDELALKADNNESPSRLKLAASEGVNEGETSEAYKQSFHRLVVMTKGMEERITKEMKNVELALVSFGLHA